MTLTGELNPAVTFYTTLNSPVLTGETNGEFNPFDFNKINTELENAKTSEVKEKTFDSLDARFEETESDVKALVADVDVALAEKADKSALTETNLRIATINKSLSDYRNAIASINVNQSPKQTASGYGTVSLPANAANGQVSVSMGGNTLTNYADNGVDYANWVVVTSGSVVNSEGVDLQGIGSGTPSTTLPITLKTSTQYTLFYEVVTSNVSTAFQFSAGNSVLDGGNITLPHTIGQQRVLFTTKSAITDNQLRLVLRNNTPLGQYVKFKNVMVIEGDYTAMPHHFIPYGTNSTISASRLKSVGKNLFDSDNAPSFTNPSCIYTKIDNGFNLSGSWYARFSIKPLKKNTYYTLSATTTTITGTPATRWTYRYTDGTYEVQTNFGSGRITDASKTVDSICVYVTIDGSVTASCDYTNIQLEEGSTATPYEPYTESNIYIPNVGELRSLPNGTKDEVSGGYHTQAVKEYTLQASDIMGLSTSWTYIDGVFISKPADYIGYGNTNATNGNVVLEGSKGDLAEITDATESIGYIGSATNDIFFYAITKGTYATLAEAQTALTGTKLTYQLSEPIVTPVNVTGTLVGHPNGTVYWEPVLPVAGVYTASRIEVTDTDFPIDTLERIAKIDFMTGVETEVDVSQAVIAGDGLSFTHENLADGDIVFFTYYHDVEGTQPEITAEYYDSRYTVKDSETEQFYRWKVTVANGVPSLVLEEV